MADSAEGNSSARELLNAHELPRFVCVEFPARVQNVDRMLKTLGGEETVSNTFTANANKKLGMKFRPEDPFSRPLYASRHQATNILLRVKKRYKKKALSEENNADEEEEDCTDHAKPNEEAVYQTELLGVIDSVYKFKGMCDFQYLPIHKNKETKEMECLIDTIIPKKPEDSTFFQQDVPYFMLPPVFSRTDLPSSYNYQPDIVPASESLMSKVANTLDTNIVGSGRARRPHNTYVVSFDEEDLPTSPQPDALTNIDKYMEKNKDIGMMREEIVQIFAKRPIWSRNALKHNCSLTDVQLKVLLPSVGFYYLTGPWRATWVRFGYDPRLDPGALKYQMLDFRIRKTMFLNKSSSSTKKHYNRFKKTSYNRDLPMSIQKPSKRRQAFIKYNETESPGAEAQIALDKESYFLFKEGLVPAYNQMFYQLCDIEDEGLQAFIQSASSETSCFLKNEDLRQLRSLMNDILKRTLIQQGIEEKSRAAKGEGDTPGSSSTSQTGEVDLDDHEMEAVDEDEEEDEEEEEEEDSGDDDDAENDEGAVEDANIDDDDESGNEIETDILEYLSGT